MSTSDKGEKLVIIEKQFVTDPSNQYEINGIIDEANALFYYRLPDRQFATLQPGSYTLTTIGSNRYLVIQQQDIIDEAEAYQVGYEFTKTSSGYTPIGQTDPEALTIKYNQLEQDFTNMFQYLKEITPRLDDHFQKFIFTELGDNQTWAYDAVKDELYAIDVVQLENAKNAAIIEITAEGDKQVTRVTGVGDQITNNLTDFRRQNELMWHMYSVIVGAHRYLSGGVLEDRPTNILDREVNGNVLEDRTQLTLRRSYNGGRLEDRNLNIDIIVDLGQF